MGSESGKVTASHLRRNAYLYVRQSTLYQVANNTESARRQYDLKGRAVALGWPADRVIVIDVDQGQSGASAADREGFQRLVAEVSLGRAGIVLGLECSRLARNSADWHKLLQICALHDTLICDEDGLYDPCSFNDRLLLGLKGTMSEAELHFLHARMQGGLLAKARRGELAVRLPVGFVYNGADHVVLDPDAGVRRAVEYLFTTFARTGSALAVVKTFATEGLKFPAHHLTGPHAGQLYWTPLRHHRVLATLHNPRYAGAYFYGRKRYLTDHGGATRTVAKPRDEWTVFIPDAHHGYIGWDQYEANQKTLAANAAAHGEQRKAGPAREGPALLQGLVVCGRCGQRMTVGYHKRRDGSLVPDYACQREGIATATPVCQNITGADIDTAVADLVLDRLTPLAIDVALTVSDEIAAHAAQADRIRASHVQRARHEAEQARRRYLAVDPTNRLVADALEADWNNRLRELADAQDEYDRASSRAEQELDHARRDRIRALATDFPALWHNPATPMRERKRLIRLLITDVTLLRGDDSITASVRFPAGQHHTLHLPRPRNAWQLHTTPDTTIATIDELLATHPIDETVTILNQRGLTGGWGKPFTGASLTALCRNRNIPSHADRLRAAGMLTLDELADELGVTTATAKRWHRLGLIAGHRIDGRREQLYEPRQPRPTTAQIGASQRPAETAQLITGFQLADRLAVSPSTVYSWFKAGLITAHAVDSRGFNLYRPDQTRPTKAEVTASQRPAGTTDLITGGQLAAKLGRSRSAIYKWYQLGLIQAVGTDKTGRHLYPPDQQPPAPAQIRQARAAARERHRQLPSSDAGTPRATS
jgi:DNA invertase Pin-like site-specific DNA recombinase/DNA-binding transcriptional MerR regulator